MVSKGVSFGPYEILGRIGAGGMGEVWRARDKRIGRDVAVKVLPDEFNAQAVKRFEQEARAAGGLNHPGLVTIFDVGTTEHSPYIVMELLEGQTLRAALGEGETGTPLPLRKAIEYAAQIATALAVAHEQGIIHRDLKPENLFITSDRRVKILDFGLAKLVTDAKDADGNRRTPQQLTGAGFTVGTPAYMSPEQVRAAPVDHRTDIFAFGAVLYEMLSGKPAFDRRTAVETMHAVLNAEPEPLDTFGRGVSPELEAIVRHCLEKDPRERFQSARDLAFQLRMLPELQKKSRSDGAAIPARRRWYRATIIAMSVALAGLAGGFVLRGLRHPAPPANRQEYKQLTFSDGIEIFPTISSDGQSFAYVSSESGNRDIYVQRVDGRSALDITSDSKADDSEPAFSPDGSQIAFRSERDGGGIFVMGVTGESVIRLTDFGHSPSWSPDGAHIAFVTAEPGLIPQPHMRESDLWIVDVKTTAKRLLINGSGPNSASDAMQPSWSPHGNRIAFWSVIRKSGRRELKTIEPDAPQPGRTIVSALADGSFVWSPVWSPGGRYLYYGSDRGGIFNLWRIRIDERTGASSGEPEPMTLPSALSCHYAFSKQGDLVYTSVTRTTRLLALPLDAETAKTGAPRVLFGTSQDIAGFEPSPDGRRIAFTSGGRYENVFVANADGSRLCQLTTGDVKDRRVTWSADGKRLYFYSNRDGGDYRIWSINVDGSALTRLTTQGTFYHPSASPDGRTLAVHPAALIHLDRPPDRRIEVLGKIIHSPTFSPDGTRLIGGAFTDAGPRSGLALYTIATRKLEKVCDRGFRPLWFPDGRRVVFFEASGIGILDLDTRRAVSSPFSMPGVELADPGFPRLAHDGSTVYVKQTFEQANIWHVRLDNE